MKINTKSLLKKIALILAGVTAISAVGVGIAKLVEYTRQDLKTINPSFEVGNIGSDGKYVNDESTLYTKEAFEAEGLQVKLDFDSQIEYQIFYYDDLDNFIESTDVLSAAYSDPVHDGYARIVIIPTDDEDGKIGLTERVTYPSQMTVKVSKVQDVEYINVYNKRLRVISDKAFLKFSLGVFHASSTGDYVFENSSSRAVTSSVLLSVKPGLTVSVSPFSDEYNFQFYIYCLSEIEGKFIVNSVLENIAVGKSGVIPENTDYVIFTCVAVESSSSGGTSLQTFPSESLSIIQDYININ